MFHCTLTLLCWINTLMSLLQNFVHLLILEGVSKESLDRIALLFPLSIGAKTSRSFSYWRQTVLCLEDTPQVNIGTRGSFYLRHWHAAPSLPWLSINSYLVAKRAEEVVRAHLCLLETHCILSYSVWTPFHTYNRSAYSFGIVPWFPVGLSVNFLAEILQSSKIRISNLYHLP